MKVIKLDTSRAMKGLETIRYTKRPDLFISASMEVGEEQGKAFKKVLGLSGEEPFPVFYKLRDSRYGILGFKKEFPKASYFPVTTYRYGEGYSNVSIEFEQKISIAKEGLLGFYDPMVSRGTTTVNTVSTLCGDSQVEMLSTFHFFVAEPGLNRLDIELQKFFLKEYFIVLGMRGFEVDTSGYMGAIMREQDYGDVMEGTYWKEYSPEIEQAMVENGVCQGAHMEVIMAYILYILLKHKYARYSNFQLIPESLKELSTFYWIQTVLHYLEKQGAKTFVHKWEIRRLRSGLTIPISDTITEALRQMEREWLIEKKVEIRSGFEGNAYQITQWGESYLTKVYLPVLGKNALLNGFVPIFENVALEIIAGKFRDLLKDSLRMND